MEDLVKKVEWCEKRFDLKIHKESNGKMNYSIQTGYMWYETGFDSYESEMEATLAGVRAAFKLDASYISEALDIL